MKPIKYLLFLLLLVLPVASGCEDNMDNSKFSDMLPYGQDYVPIPPAPDDPTLKDVTGWNTDTLSTGFIYYNYENVYSPFSANQIVNVLEVNLADPNYRIEVVYTANTDTLSAIANDYDAIAGINGTYELDASFIKTNGVVYSQVTLDEDHLRFWKHEGAFFYNGIDQAALSYGTNNEYAASSYPNILSAAPMLIDNYNLVGVDFVGNVSGLDLNSLEYEDYRRHQGVRHPRTALALTENNKLLLITVDGRWDKAAGMSAAELTRFINNYFEPMSALNLDGGGSTTMWIKGTTASPHGVVNYPTDNNIFDHTGQRSLRTFILVKRTADEPPFAGGTGTQYDPYIITQATHMNNIKNIDWSDAETNPPYFKLEADIDMGGISWIPINNADPYSRHLHFDGNGHVIKNLTVKGAGYGSLFGVLCGSCKNLGVINAWIESTSGGGIIAGYAGLKGPDKPTGMIENCFTSGIVYGTDAVGGIVGNIGKPNGIEVSGVRNCYSTATVIATVESGNSRSGGIAGIVFEKGVLENSYSTGAVTSSNFGAGGIVGWTDTEIKGHVAMNESIRNIKSGAIGRIGYNMGSVGGIIAQGINCWALETIRPDNAGTIKQENEMNTGVVSVANNPYDGETKTKEFLSNPENYKSAGWNMAGNTPVWAPVMSSKGFPILKWLYDRTDYPAVDGHN